MCENFRFEVNYYEGKKIRKDLFSDYAEMVVNCFLAIPDKSDGRDRRGNPRKKLSYSQIRKFYDEVLGFKNRLDNGEDFLDILPYFRMLKAKANVAFNRDVINTNFKTFIEKNVDYIGDDKEKFKVFVTFFEAVVAYSKGKFKE